MSRQRMFYRGIYKILLQEEAMRLNQEGVREKETDSRKDNIIAECWRHRDDMSKWSMMSCVKVKGGSLLATIWMLYY